MIVTVALGLGDGVVAGRLLRTGTVAASRSGARVAVETGSKGTAVGASSLLILASPSIEEWILMVGDCPEAVRDQAQS